MLHRQTHINEPRTVNKPDTQLNSLQSTQETLKSLCDVALGPGAPSSSDSTVLVTPEEAAALLNSLVEKDVLKERIRKIEIERKPYRVEFTARFNKYFETMGHNGIIERICFDRGCKYAFTGGADGIIKCWSVPDGMLVRSLYGHGNLISDLCINKEGKLLVSVDCLGVLNIWSLERFELLNTVNLGSEAIFCEFIEGGPANEAISTGKIFVVLADGTVSSITFMQSEILEHKKNNFMEGESIKSICITDGGRMVICGGWWPFILIYDTQDLERMIVLEDFKIQTLCAAKNSLKFAACSENQIFSYTFYCEGEASMGNYLKKRTNSELGYWKKHVNAIAAGELVEGLSYLASFLLVAACSDGIIRVYEDDQLVLSFPGEAGTIYAHPTHNILAVVGTRLTMYQIGGDGREEYRAGISICDSDGRGGCRVACGSPAARRHTTIFTENIFISLNDCQFSDDGRFFVTCDDQGVIRAYSVYEPIAVPEQQFFISDLAPTASEFGETVNFYRQRNTEWYAVPYRTTAGGSRNRCCMIEEVAISTLERLKVEQEKFKGKYLSRLYETEPTESEEEQSDDETYVMSEGESVESSSSEEEEEEESVGKLRGFRRRLVETESSGRRGRRFIVEESSEEVMPRRVVTRHMASEETGRQDETARRRLRSDLTAPRHEAGVARHETRELISTREGLPREVSYVSSRELPHVSSRELPHEVSYATTHTTPNAQHATSQRNARRLRRDNQANSPSNNRDLNESGINSEFESVLTDFSYNWLASCSLYLNSQIYFNLPAYMEFMQLEPRLVYAKSYPRQSGIFTVTSRQAKFIGRIPYLTLGLNSHHSIKVYEHPESTGILCTADQYSIKVNQSILCYDHELISGTVNRVGGMKVAINTARGGIEMLKSLALIQYDPLGISQIEYSTVLKALFGKSRGRKFMQKPIVNYSLINLKLERNLYRSREEVVEDLKYLSEFEGLEEDVRVKAREIYHEYTL